MFQFVTFEGLLLWKIFGNGKPLRGKLVQSEGIKLPDGRKIRNIGDDDGYKYRGVLEVDNIMHEVMKSNMEEYTRRVKKALTSKLKSGKVIKAVNNWAVSLLQYSGGVINWTMNELAGLDRTTGKLLTMYGALHPRSNVSRPYLPRRDRRRVLISVQDAIYT